MQTSAAAEVTYDIALFQRDLTLRGWLPIDLARAARVSHTSVHRFLTGERRTPRMAKKLAKALGHPLDRYLQRTTRPDDRRTGERRDGDRRAHAPA